MAVARELRTYPTKPVECWGKMKELRRKHFRHIWEAHKKGEVTVMGMSEAFLALPAGLGHYASQSYGPYFTRIMREKTDIIKFHEASEARGFNRDTCCAMRVHMGQMFMGLTTRNPLTGETTVPDFIFQPNFCINAGRTGRYLSEMMGIPYLVVDLPHQDTPATREYLVNEIMAAIEWMEKATGRKYDDERFIEGTLNEWESMNLWSQVCCLSKVIPAPLDARHLMSLRQPIFTMRHEQEVVDYLRELLGETQERVAQGISARGFELARLLIEPGCPFFYPNLFRYPERYGAIVVASQEFMDAFGVWEVTPEGRWLPAPTPQQRGTPLRTREDAAKSQAELYLKYHRTTQIYDITAKIADPATKCKDWKGDGIIFHSVRGCRAMDGYIAQAKILADEMGIPTTLYEGTHADPRDFDEVQVLDRFDAFLESLGLTKLQAEEPPRPEKEKDEEV